MRNEEKDLRDRTKSFALRIVEMFLVIPKTTEAQVLGKQVLFQARRWEQIIAKHIADAARRNLSQSAAIRCASLKRLPTGSSCSSMEGSSRQKSSQLFDKNATNSSPYSLRF